MTLTLARRLGFALLRRTRGGAIELREGGRRARLGAQDENAPLHGVLEVRDGRFWLALLRGSRGLGGAYADGLWASPDLVPLVRIAARNAHRFDHIRDAWWPVLGPWRALTGRIRQNTEARSRRQIAHHYDLGNDLYELMLDPSLMYSAAKYERRDMTLEEAQRAKLDAICEKLELRPSDHLLEIGTGWGSMAIHAAAQYGCRVTTTTISREQRDRAVARIREAGLEDRVTVLLEDYRRLTGRYDKLVSIEMIEAVGWRHFGTFFRTCSRLLRPDGAMLLQAITIDDRAFHAEKATRSFIRTYIFPGGCLPSMEIISRNLARRTDMHVLDLEDLTGDYVLTLQEWRRNVDASTARLEQLGYDERFRRLWRMYLAYCEAGFAERRIGDVQLLLAKPAFHRRSQLAAAPAAATAAA